MKSRKFKTFYDRKGNPCHFDSTKFKEVIRFYKKQKQLAGIKITDEMIRQEIGEYLCLTPESIKNWHYGYNGPSSFEQVVLLAKHLNVNIEELLELEKENREVESTKDMTIVEGTTVQNATTREIIKNIYLQFVKLNRSLYNEEYNIPTFDAEDDSYQSFDDYLQAQSEKYTAEEIEAMRLEMDYYEEERRSRCREYYNLCRAFKYYMEDNMLDIPVGDYDKILRFYEAYIEAYIDAYSPGLFDYEAPQATIEKLYEKYQDQPIVWSEDKHSVFWEDTMLLKELLYRAFFVEARVVFGKYIAL